MLIYGARNPAVRPMALAVAGASKAIFIAVVVDAVWVGVFAAYLVSTRRTRTAELNVAPAKTP